MNNSEHTEAAVCSLRDAHQAAKNAVQEWVSTDEGRGDVIATAIIERLGECATDMNGDDTLEVVSELFEEFWKTIPDHLAHALASLAKAAHALGRARSTHTER